MTDCVRHGNFDKNEVHQCFKIGCTAKVYPALVQTCSKCNWKPCEAGHCGCHLTKSARYAVDVLYKTYCDFCKRTESPSLAEDDRKPRHL